MLKIALTLIIIASTGIAEAQVDLAPLQALTNSWYPTQQNQVKPQEYEIKRPQVCTQVPVYSPWTNQIVRYEVHCD